MKDETKQKIITLGASVFVIGILLFVGILFRSKQLVAPVPGEGGNQTAPYQTTTTKPSERLMQKQVEGLNTLRTYFPPKPATKSEIDKQMGELDALRRQSGVKPLTSSTINHQLQELDKLRR